MSEIKKDTKNGGVLLPADKIENIAKELFEKHRLIVPNIYKPREDLEEESVDEI